MTISEIENILNVQNYQLLDGRFQHDIDTEWIVSVSGCEMVQDWTKGQTIYIFEDGKIIAEDGEFWFEEEN